MQTSNHVWTQTLWCCCLFDQVVVLAKATDCRFSPGLHTTAAANACSPPPRQDSSQSPFAQTIQLLSFSCGRVCARLLLSSLPPPCTWSSIVVFRSTLPANSVGDVENLQVSIRGCVLGVAHVFRVRHEGPPLASRQDPSHRRAHHVVPGSFGTAFQIRWFFFFISAEIRVSWPPPLRNFHGTCCVVFARPFGCVGVVMIVCVLVSWCCFSWCG